VAPDAESDIGGYRSIDRATLAEAREYVFFAGEPSATPYREPTMSFCSDVLPLFYQKCTGACHGADPTYGQRAGLVLDSARGVAGTAIGRVAQGSNTASNTSAAQSETRQFGVQMP